VLAAKRAPSMMLLETSVVRTLSVFHFSEKVRPEGERNRTIKKRMQNKKTLGSFLDAVWGENT
jgi:hypothetical protein